jgi:hypothetical protein
VSPLGNRLDLINPDHLEWQMQTLNLENVVTVALDSIGHRRILEIVPDLVSLRGWTNESLAGIMMDSNDVILDKEYLLFFRDFFRSAEAVQKKRASRFDKLTGNLAIKLRYQTDTIGIKYHSGNEFNSITVVRRHDADTDYAPVVGVAIREDPGPLRAALDSIFILAYKHTALPTLTNRFVKDLLRLWREVLQIWIQPTCERKTSPEIGQY